MVDYFEKEVGRREALKMILGTAAAVAGGFGVLSLFDELHSEKVSTDIYSKNWKPIAEETLEKIKDYNRKIDSSFYSLRVQDEINSIYLDPVLQEYPYLKEKGLIKNDEIELGRYVLKIEGYEGPVMLDNGKFSDVEVKISVFDKKKGDYIDLNWMPFVKSKWIDLRTDDYTLEKILKMEKSLF